MALCVSLATTGCANLGQVDTDHGPYPDDYQSLVRRYYKATFDYPKHIADAAMAQPQKVTLRYSIKGQRFAYLVCTRRITIGRYGAYTGLQIDAILIKNGAVIAYADRGVLHGDALCPSLN